MKQLYPAILIILIMSHCNTKVEESDDRIIAPKVVTQKAKYDTDDPAIWFNEENPGESLVLGTDKDEDGALMVYDLSGNIIEEKTIRGLKRPNNVDLRTVRMDNERVSIAVVTERLTDKVRIYTVPDMLPADNGGIDVFIGEEDRAPMGIALYNRPNDGALFMIVGRKTGPAEGYLWQYRLEKESNGHFSATKVRAFGKYSGKKEIEAIAVDDELGYVYYSDEQVGVRKYYADPEKGNEELALFATKGFTDDHEGISIYKKENGKGYILVSDQQANQFHIFTREGQAENPHQHVLLKTIKVAAMESDGSEVINANLGPMFPNGLFVVMSTDKTFHFYDWTDIAGDLAEGI
ncbi:phytase [Anditalea andensis]|uniref:3-phytase n=1 Tax=Anditalea andensis TaxID=1048983 RepID=A0A074L360_9BACT|nr:phytase [Anditalea andensis]KEO75594.1 3-phytase [Anditalea andensis]